MVLKGVMDKKPKKIRHWKICHFEPNLIFNLFCFLRMSFFNFFLNHMVKGCQNEIAPIFCCGVGTGTGERDLEMHDLHALALGRVKKITLYIILLISTLV